MTKFFLNVKGSWTVGLLLLILLVNFDSCVGTKSIDYLLGCKNDVNAKEIFCSFQSNSSKDIAIYRSKTKVSIIAGQIMKKRRKEIQVIKKSCPLHSKFAFVLLKELSFLVQLAASKKHNSWFPKASPYLFYNSTHKSIGFLMEKMPGITIKRWLELPGSIGNFSLGHMKMIIWGVRDALKYLQKKNIFHFDISMSNILVEESGKKFHIVDFGNSILTEPGDQIERGEDGLYRFDNPFISDNNFDFLCLKDSLKAIVENELFMRDCSEFTKSFIFGTDEEFLNQVWKITSKECIPLSHRGSERMQEWRLERELMDKDHLQCQAIDSYPSEVIIQNLRDQFPISNEELRSTVRDPSESPKKSVSILRKSMKETNSLMSKLRSLQSASERSLNQLLHRDTDQSEQTQPSRISEPNSLVAAPISPENVPEKKESPSKEAIEVRSRICSKMLQFHK